MALTFTKVHEKCNGMHLQHEGIYQEVLRSLNLVASVLKFKLKLKKSKRCRGEVNLQKCSSLRIARAALLNFGESRE